MAESQSGKKRARYSGVGVFAKINRKPHNELLQ